MVGTIDGELNQLYTKLWVSPVHLGNILHSLSLCFKAYKICWYCGKGKKKKFWCMKTVVKNLLFLLISSSCVYSGFVSVFFAAFI